MKYMGSKKWMLGNGLGSLLRQEGQSANRIVDLFCGSGVVAWYAAENTNKEVIAFDLQEYATVLAGSVIERTSPVDCKEFDKWFDDAHSLLNSWPKFSNICPSSISSEEQYVMFRESVMTSRHETLPSDIYAPIFEAYAGHYLSPYQALVIDALRATLPDDQEISRVALASLISAASACVASPGHTAQPFQPTHTALKYIYEAWSRDPFDYVIKALTDLNSRYASSRGYAETLDAIYAVERLEDGDLVIVDPPYSGVHYSRFYHVLETVARGSCGPVDGRGRYPPLDERPRSDFSMKSQAPLALEVLLGVVAEKGATVILTFPAGKSSNGLTGEEVLRIARKQFLIEKQTVSGKFSTLGGNSRHRPARQTSEELLLLLVPR